MIVIGCDPGEKTAFASYEDGKLVNLWTLNPLNALNYLSNQSHTDGILYVMEDSRLQTFVFDRGTSERVRLKIARDVGRVDLLCKLYQEALGKNKLIRVSPLQKGAKVIDSEIFNRMTGWNKGSSQHTRDAAMIARPFRYGAK